MRPSGSARRARVQRSPAAGRPHACGSCSGAPLTLRRSARRNPHRRRPYRHLGGRGRGGSARPLVPMRDFTGLGPLVHGGSPHPGTEPEPPAPRPPACSPARAPWRPRCVCEPHATAHRSQISVLLHSRRTSLRDLHRTSARPSLHTLCFMVQRMDTLMPTCTQSGPALHGYWTKVFHSKPAMSWWDCRLIETQCKRNK